MNTNAAPRWHAEDRYLPTLASRAGLLEETRLFLREYANTGSTKAACEALRADILPQRSSATRTTTMKVIRKRLVQWHPPDWVQADLVAWVDDMESLKAALLLHTARQDSLLYDFIHEVVIPKWQDGMRVLTHSDVLFFLIISREDHPEIQSWSRSTREKLASNVLRTLQDYGLLKGTVQKSITLPIVPTPVVAHLVRLLRAEGVKDEHLVLHADWQLWLWDETWTRRAIHEVVRPEPTFAEKGTYL